MKTWLFKWNPGAMTIGESVDKTAELREQLAMGKRAGSPWYSGYNHDIEEGDRIFFIRPDADKRGIVASGHAMTRVLWTEIYLDDVKTKPWKDIAREYVNFVSIEFDKIVDMDADEGLTYEQLRAIDGTFDWSPQDTAILIPEETAAIVERYWQMV